MSVIKLWSDNIVIHRMESNFDRASDIAYSQAIARACIDENGHSMKIKGWERHNSWIQAEFTSYVIEGPSSHVYTFKAIALKNVE